MFASLFTFLRKFFGLFTHVVDQADRGLGIGDKYLTHFEEGADESIELARIERAATLAQRRKELEQSS